MTQNEKVLKYLNEHKNITQRKANKLGVYRLSARVLELKRSGYNIRSAAKRVKNSDGTYSTIAEYRMEGSEWSANNSHSTPAS